MLNIEKEKKQEIDKMVSITEQLDIVDIQLLLRDANTLLLRQRVVEDRENKKAG